MVVDPSPNLSSHKSAKLNKMMVRNQKEVGSLIISKMDNQAKLHSNNQAMEARFKVKAISKSVKINIISIWTLKSNLSLLKIIMVFLNKVEE